MTKGCEKSCEQSATSSPPSASRTEPPPLGLTQVKEFEVDDLTVHLWPDSYVEGLEAPETPPDFLDPEADLFGMWWHRWLDRGDFVIEWGNDLWDGPDGNIHSS